MAPSQRIHAVGSRYDCVGPLYALNDIAGQLEQDARLHELGGVLRRTLRALPDRQLGALIRGLDANLERLAPGRLFVGPRGAAARSA